MITLNNILMNKDGVIVIYFTYEHKNVEFSGQIRLTKKQFIKSHNNGDSDLSQFVWDTLEQELNWLIYQ